MKLPKKIKLPKRRIKNRNSRSFTWLYVGLTITVFVVGIALYSYNSTFQKNIDLALSYIAQGTHKVVRNEPYVSEKNGQAFVLYDHPLVNVTIIKDSECAGTRCEYPNLTEEIQKQITPLVKIYEVDSRSPEGIKALENISWPMLPVVIFDKTIEKISDFDQLKDLFNQDGENYLLRLQPYATRILPKYNNATSTGYINKNYPIKIVEYSSYTCTFCAKAQETINSLLQKYPDDIVLYQKHLLRNENDLILARGSECASSQGKFWEMHKALFENQESFLKLEQTQYLDKLLQIAHQIYLPDQVAFRECVKSDTYDSKIQKQIDEAGELGIDTTPVFFINEAVIPGAMDFSEFEAVVRHQLGL